MEQNKLDESNDSDESQKSDCDDWSRVRSAIEHENTLVNHRLSWLGTSQGLLFGVFGVILNAYMSNKSEVYFFLLFVIGSLGVLICSFIWLTLWQARIQLRSLDCWWYSEDRSKLADNNQWFELVKNHPRKDSVKNLIKKLPKHPPIQSYKLYPIPKFVTDFVNDFNIPFLFILGWATILYILITRPLV